jgi:NADPH:quinone reductase-like Zn-dependent oxidoreductase
MKNKVSISQLLQWRLSQAEATAPPAPRAAGLLEMSRPWWETWPEQFRSLAGRLGRMQIAYGYAMAEPRPSRGGFPVPVLVALAGQEFEACASVLYLNVRNDRLVFRFQLDGVACETHQVTGISFDGGYSEYMIAPVSAVARFPDDLPPIDAAPLLCAGITTFNALRNSGARPGDVVAVLGLGGLGHLGVQYAAKSGFQTVAIARGKDKEPLARQLGASAYIDSQSQDPAAELQKLGGANVILSTVTVGDAMSAVQGGLAVKGTLIVIGAAESLQLSPIALLMGNRSVKGWYSGTSIDSEDTLAFSARRGVRSMNETFPLDRVNEAYDRMMSGKARFRVVLTMK